MDQGILRLVVAWSRDAGQILSARVDCQRPQAAGLLAGRPVSEALALVPRLFNLCRHAQEAAATLAVAAAEGRPAAADEDTLLAVAREAIGEHLWRLLLDWPALAGQPPEKQSFLDWRKRLLSAKTPQDNRQLGRELLDWLPSAPGIPVPEHPPANTVTLLPWRKASDWASIPIDQAFARMPNLSGEPAETGALARHGNEAPVAGLLAAGRRLAARLAARRADLEFLALALGSPERMSHWLDAAPAGNGIGIARVETARGLLLHLTQVNDRRVGHHVIVAPSEWNFHPQGACVRELAGQPAASRVEATMLARQRALALDPCINYEVMIEDA